MSVWLQEIPGRGPALTARCAYSRGRKKTLTVNVLLARCRNAHLGRRYREKLKEREPVLIDRYFQNVKAYL